MTGNSSALITEPKTSAFGEHATFSGPSVVTIIMERSPMRAPFTPSQVERVSKGETTRQKAEFPESCLT